MTPEEGARWRKIAHLVTVLYLGNIRPPVLTSMGEPEWKIAARIGKVNMPSSKTTSQLTEMVFGIFDEQAEKAMVVRRANDASPE